MDYNLQNNSSLILSTDRLIFQIYINNITFIECDSYVTMIHFMDSKEVLSTSILLKELELFLGQYYFFRINKQVLLNLRYLNNIDINKRRLTLYNGLEFTISYRKLKLFRGFITKIRKR